MYLGSPKNPNRKSRVDDRFLPAPCCPKRNLGLGQCLKANNQRWGGLVGEALWRWEGTSNFETYQILTQNSFITQIFGPNIWLPKVIRVIEGKRGKTHMILEKNWNHFWIWDLVVHHFIRNPFLSVTQGLYCQSFNALQKQPVPSRKRVHIPHQTGSLENHRIKLMP